MERMPETSEHRSTPLSPEDLYAQARRFQVDLAREPFLLPVIKQAATTATPPKWRHEEQQQASDRPEERYFLDQIQELRQQQHGEQQSETTAWMAFEELVPKEQTDAARKTAATRTTTRKLTTTYYFDFVSRRRQETHPLVPLVGHSGMETDDDVDVMARAADPRVFERASALHTQSSMKNLENLQILCFHSWWRETSLQGETRQCRLRLYFSIPTRHFQVALDDSPNVFTISHIAHPVTGASLAAWDLHEGARLIVLGRSTTLRQASLLTRQWLQLHERRLTPVREQLQCELAKYELRSHGRSAAAPACGRVLCADPHRSRAGVSLRALLDEISMLQTRLAAHRPDLARRLCEPLAGLDDS